MFEEQIEFTKFTRKQIEEIVKEAAIRRLMGGFYRRYIGEQEIRWTSDGSLVVITKHRPKSRR